jgi:hypothetical protein
MVESHLGIPSLELKAYEQETSQENDRLRRSLITQKRFERIDGPGVKDNGYILFPQP